MRDDEQPAASRVSAASAILDRGHGRPAQAVTVGGDEETGPIRHTFEWLNEGQ
jgi:hypothetical protein